MAHDERDLAALRRVPDEDRPRDPGRRARAHLGCRLDRVAGIGVGIAMGWNIALLGPIATQLSHVYGVSLATVGAVRDRAVRHAHAHADPRRPRGRPLGRAHERARRRRRSSRSATRSRCRLREPALAFLGRAIVGVGTGFAFVGGSDYIRARGGSPFLQGIYGGGSVLAPGIAVAVVPLLAEPLRLARGVRQRDRRLRGLRGAARARARRGADRRATPASGSAWASSATGGCTASLRSTRCRSASA